MKLSTREKFIVGMNYFIGFLIAAKYTMMIDFSNINPHFNDWLLLVFFWFFTTVLAGTPLFCLSVMLDHKTGKYFTKEELFTSRSGLDSIGIATAYTMVLYLLGLTDSFFPIVNFYQ